MQIEHLIHSLQRFRADGMKEVAVFDIPDYPTPEEICAYKDFHVSGGGDRTVHLEIKRYRLKPEPPEDRVEPHAGQLNLTWLKYLAMIVISFGLMYLAFAFVNLELNISKWSPDKRCGYLCLSLIVAVIAVGHKYIRREIACF